jgi:hypothetical protein
VALEKKKRKRQVLQTILFAWLFPYGYYGSEMAKLYNERKVTLWKMEKNGMLYIPNQDGRKR